MEEWSEKRSLIRATWRSCRCGTGGDADGLLMAMAEIALVTPDRSAQPYNIATLRYDARSKN
jgi:hypothetical protein